MRNKTDQGDRQSISLRQAIRNNFLMLRMAWKISKKRVVLDFTFNILDSLFGYYYNVIFTAVIFSAIDKAVDFRFVMGFIFLTTALLLVFSVFQVWYQSKFRPQTDILFFQKFNLEVFKKAADVELACYENTEFYDKYTRAASEANGRMIALLDNLTRFIGIVISFIMATVTIFALDPLAVVFIVLPIIGSLLFQLRKNKLYFNLEQKNTESNRMKAYVNRTIYLEQYAKDIRLSNIFSVLMKNYARAIQGLIRNYQTDGKKVGAYRALDTVLGHILFWPIVIIYAAFRVLVTKTVSASTFVVLINTVSNMMHSVNALMGLVTEMQRSGLFIQNFRDFMDYTPKIAQSQDGIRPVAGPHTLSFRDMSYTYEGADKPVLKHINFTIHPGEKIALVGHNGAGKTTLIKLLMRLYDPTQGRILLDGEDIKSYQVESFRKLFGTVFQDYRVFSMSVADNVLMRPADAADEAAVVSALSSAGVMEKISSLPAGIHTTLTREFDDEGAMLSGGEFQKIAIARLFASGCEFAILDEPSSALDPIAEYKMFESLKRVCEDRTVIFISHRLSSAVLADRIYMMEQGEIIESGTHDELMRRQGKYAEMFTKQAKMYGMAGGGLE